MHFTIIVNRVHLCLRACLCVFNENCEPKAQAKKGNAEKIRNENVWKGKMHVFELMEKYDKIVHI